MSLCSLILNLETPNAAQSESLTVIEYSSHYQRLIRLCICTGWSEPLMVTHTSLLEISCPGFYGKCFKISLFSFCSQINCWFPGLEFTKCLSEYQTGKTLVSLQLQKQSCPGLHCLCRIGIFWQATSVRNFRSFTILYLLYAFNN